MLWTWRTPRRMGGTVWCPIAVLFLILGTLCVGAVDAAYEAPAIDPRRAEVLWRWVGLLESGVESCVPEDLPTSWTARRLFSAAGRSRWPALDEFCLFEYTGGGGIPQTEVAYIDLLDGSQDYTAASIGGVSTRRTLKTVAPDLAAVAPSGVLKGALWPSLAELFDEQAGRALIVPGNGAPKVRLTLIDTSPTGTGALSESSPHGRSLRLMAERLLCPTGSCVADLGSRLALAYEVVDRDSRDGSIRNDQEGGFIGLVSELAEAIVGEVDDWDTMATAGERLILNLSLGWDPVYGGGDINEDVDDMPPTVQAVFRGLESVSCDGRALAVVAAGNLADLHAANNPQQSLLPAAWRERDADCGGGSGPPLAVAVAAVDKDRDPLVTAITADLPELAAYGDHGVAEDPSTSGGSSAVLTGSSVSALVAAAAITAVASYRPDLSLESVVNKVYDSGTPGAQAGLCSASHGGNCPNLRAVKLCEAVGAACAQGTGYCPQAIPACSNSTLPLPNLPAQPPPFPVIDVGVFAQVRGGCLTCGPTQAYRDPGQAPAEPCPDRQYHGAGRLPYAHEQPGAQVCPQCLYYPFAGQTYVEIKTVSTLGPGELLTSPTLELLCGTTSMRYQLKDAGLPTMNGDAFVLSELPFGCQSGKLSFVIEDGSGNAVASTTQPLFIAD